MRKSGTRTKQQPANADSLDVIQAHIAAVWLSIIFNSS
jgi:hypothetical protein